MEQEYVYTILSPFMFETVQSQAYDVIYMDSILSPKLICIIEILFTFYTLPDTKSFVWSNTYMSSNQLNYENVFR